MKIRGLLAVFLLVVAIIYFLMFIKTGKNESPPIKAEVDRFIRTQMEMTKVNMSAIEKSLELYAATYGSYPKKLDTLITSGLLNGFPVDGWGRTLRYERISDSSFSLRSAGPDGRFDTEDDIVR